MASKEFTVFAIDLSPSMGECNNGRKITDLEFGLKYFYNHVSDLIIKERKQDRLAVVLCHSPVTDNAHVNEDSLNNIRVIYKNEQFTYQKLKECSKILVANSAPIKHNEGDCLETMLVGVGLFKDTAKYKITRNLVIITNAKTTVSTFNSKLAEVTVSAISNMNINVYLNCIDMFDSYSSPVKRENVKNWKSLIKLYNGNMFNTQDINRAILYQPPLKKIRPVSSFQGNLTFGSSLEQLISSNKISTQSNITIAVQVLPAIKTEKMLASHQYVVNGNNADNIGDELTYYIKNSELKVDTAEEDEKDNNVKQVITKGEWDDGFKYSNMDMIALDKELLSSTKMPVSVGMDIYGFIKKKNLPFAYFTKEASYVVPSAATTKRNLISFNALCKSLIDLKSVSLVRYVPNSNKDIETCALLPQKFSIDSGLVYGFILIRLAFKEDEKTGRFPYLTSVTSTSGNSTKDDYELQSSKNENADKISNLQSLLPSENVNNLMELFIQSKDLDNGIVRKDTDDTTLKNSKLSLFESEKLIVPKEYVKDVDARLIPSSPAIQKFNLNLKKILIKSLKERNLHEFLNDDKFIENVLVPSDEDSYENIKGKPPTNLFNLSNILSLNTGGTEQWLDNIDDRSHQFADELIKELGISVVKEEKSKKQKYDDSEKDDLYNNNKKPNYGQSEGVYDEAIDLNKLLG